MGNCCTLNQLDNIQIVWDYKHIQIEPKGIQETDSFTGCA